MTRPRRHRLSESERRFAYIVTSVLVLSLLGLNALAHDAPSRFVLRGSYYGYGFFGQGSNVDTFGPKQDTFSTTFEFPDGGALDRSIISTIYLSGSDGVLSVSLMNEALLQAPRLAGNDFGGGFTGTADIYILGPPGTPYYIRRSLNGTATAVRGGGLGTTQADLLGSTAVVNNGSGSQSVPVTVATGREFAGNTSTTPHPSVAGYRLAGSVSIPAWGFTFQSFDFCFPGCPQLLNFRSTSVIDGTIAAGPCCPPSPELPDWNSPNSTRTRNNCYNYATNRRTGGWSQPGGLPPDLPEYTCELVENAAAIDGFVPMEFADPNSCGPGQSVVALFIAPPEVNHGIKDAHWYRRNCDGTWSHKQGLGPAKVTDSAGRIITDPQSADRTLKFTNGATSPGYSIFCGYFCIPCEFDLAPAPAPAEPESREPSGLIAQLQFRSMAASPEWMILDMAEIELIRQMVFDGPLSEPLVERAALGYSGMTLTPSGGLPGMPEFIRVLDGVIEIADSASVEYRTDSMNLEGYLLDQAVAEGFGAYVDEPTTQFSRGDVDGDGELNISDPIYSLAYQFAGEPPPQCLDAADDDDSGEVNISDPIYSLNYQFAGGPPPPAPFPGCGSDPTADAIGCDALSPCDGKARPAPQVTRVVDGSKQLLLERIPGTSPDTLSLKVTVVTDSPLAGLEGMAGFDPSRLQFVRLVRSGSGPQMDFLSARNLADPSRVRLGGVPDFGFADVLASGTHEIGRLVFARRDPAAPLNGAVWLTEGRFVGRDLTAYQVAGGPVGDLDASGTQEGSSTAGLVIVFPNPYHPNGPIGLGIERPVGEADLAVYDVQGRRVRSLYLGPLGAVLNLAWDGRADDGKEVAAGLYYLRIDTGSHRETRGLLLLR